MKTKRMHSPRRLDRARWLMVTAGALLWGHCAWAQNVISINFVGGGAVGGTPSNLAATDVAGVFAVSNWNNVAVNLATGTVSGLLNNIKTATPASVQWACDNTWSTVISQSTPDFKLMKGYLDNPNHDTTVTVSGIPYLSYDVYVYFNDDNTTGGTIGAYTIGGTTIFGKDNGVLFNGTYVQASGTNATDANAIGNFLGFQVVTGSNFTLTAHSVNTRAPVNGLQIINRTPSSDTCSGAILMSAGYVYSLNTTYATSTGDPIPSCTGTPANGVWYEFIPAQTGPVIISTCGSDFHTVLSVFAGGCGSLAEVPGGCNEGYGPACSNSNASVAFDGVVGTPYWILAGGVAGARGNLSIVANYGPPNDQCFNATTLVPGITNTIDTTWATSTNDPVPGCVTNPVKGVWYSVTPAVSGPMSISTCGSDFSTVLAVYTGSCGSLTPLPGACSDGTGSVCSGQNASVSFSAVAGTTYWVLAGGNNGQTGNLSLIALLGTPPVNDQLAGAIDISSGDVYVEDTRTATSVNDPAPDYHCGSLFNGVWFAVTVPNQGRGSFQKATITLDFSGSDYQPNFEIYETFGNSLLSVGCGSLSTDVGSGTFYVLVGSGDGTGGNLHIRADVCTIPQFGGFDISQSLEADGLHVTFCANIIGTPPPSYTWTYSGPAAISNYSLGSCYTVVVSPAIDDSTQIFVSVNFTGCRGGDHGSGSTTFPCSFCLSRGTPGLFAGTTGSGASLTASGTLLPLGSNTRWYRMLAYDNGPITVSAEGSSNVNEIAVCAGPSIASLTNIMSVIKPQTRLTFSAVANTTYWFAVDPGTNSPSTLRVASGFEPSIQSAGVTNGVFELLSTVAPPTTYKVLASTNPALPFSNWPVVFTTNWNSNYPVSDFHIDFKETNLMNPRQKFYRLAPGP